MSFQISPQLLHIYTPAFPQFSPAQALAVKPPEFVPRLSNGLMCHWTLAGTELLSVLPFASWFLSLLKDTSAVHHLLGRVLLLFEPWGWHRGSTTSLLSPIRSSQICMMVRRDDLQRPLFSITFLPCETTYGSRRICPWGESSLDHNLACAIPNLLSLHAPGLVVSQLTFFNPCSSE